ncbi:dihydropteroate synthase [Clostridium sp. SHJSY1]|uniref:dihydropteroate synthase n=1 Tax=Clostridium sp. SHJSY1 TaxID=2942483 RepID=UPI00287608B8|nr:dihydropteroate synthase [Clostridium sp. SHJSY1]MDS0524301.1 dihydropteroate synthase [Clostridium sp. SHJSY1]
MRIGKKNFEIGKRTYIMGILNVTPDSFSDGGKYNNVEKAILHTRKMIEQGADIIDIGGESTRPGYTCISDEEEISRVIPVIEALRKETDIPISVDSYKSKVIEASLKAGADIINDIWGFKKDFNMAKIAAKYNATCLLMHNRDNMNYENFMKEVLNDLMESINIALRAGVKPENIIIDPGVGFAKTYEQNLEVMNNLEELATLGYPVLLATSKKRMIGTALNLDKDERIEGTVATTVIGIMKNCDFVRVHNVKENKRAALMTDAIVRI